MIELVPVLGSELRRRWHPEFRFGVCAVIRKCNTDFIAEDIYRELSEERSFLYQILKYGEVIGFTVLSQYTDRFSNRNVLCMDLTWLESNEVDYPSLVVALDDLARAVGAEKIEWFSPREGWTRVMPEYGFVPSSRSYSREVPQ